MSRRSGFTLIELSIVLVIIGLIVGGILAGTDLIRAARVRLTISQIEKLNTAAQTFKSKYGGLPGDLANETDFGFTAVGCVGGGACVKNNGLIDSCAINDGVHFGCENKFFWNQITQAGLFEGSFTNTQAYDSWATLLGSPSLYVPPTKMSDGTYLLVLARDWRNYIRIDNPEVEPLNGYSMGDNSNAGSVYTYGNGVTPLIGYMIDSKTDDGVPTSGKTVAYNGSSLFTTLGASNAAGCQYPANQYNISLLPNKGLCSIGIDASF